MKIRIILALAVVAALVVFVQGSGKKESTAEAPKGDLDFTLTNFDGKEMSLSDFAGKIIVLEWTSYDCPFVIRHYKAGTMVETAKKFADKDIVWLAINSTYYTDAASNKNLLKSTE